MTTKPPNDIAAVVCTRDRPQQLVRAVESLLRQEPPLKQILVVDNSPSSGEVRELVARRFPSIRYVCEPIPGLDFARNRALNESECEILAYLDDDAIAEPGWAAAIGRAFRDTPRLAVVTTRIEPLSLQTEAQCVFERNGGFSRGAEPVQLPRDRSRPLHGRQAPLVAWAVSIGCGCAFALRRDAALDSGGFDVALDMSPNLPGGGDLDMIWRLILAGFDVTYEPRAIARHEHRRELDDVFDQIVGHQRALLAFLTKSLQEAPAGERSSLGAFMIWRLFKPGIRLSRALIGRDELPVHVLWRMWWNCWKGVFAYSAAKRVAQERSHAAIIM